MIEIRVTVGDGAATCRFGCLGSAWPCVVRPGGVCFVSGRLLIGRHRLVGGNHVGGVPVEAAAGTVVSHSGPGIGVRGGFLHVTERDPCVEGGGDERMPQRMRSDRLGDSGADGHPANYPGGTVAVQPLTIGAAEDRPVHALADGQVNRPRGAWC